MTALIKLMQKPHIDKALPYHCIEKLDWLDRLAAAADLLELFDDALLEVIQQPNVTPKEIEDSVHHLRLFSRCAGYLIENTLEDVDNRETIEEREFKDKSKK